MSDARDLLTSLSKLTSQELKQAIAQKRGELKQMQTLLRAVASRERTVKQGQEVAAGAS